MLSTKPASKIGKPYFITISTVISFPPLVKRKKTHSGASIAHHYVSTLRVKKAKNATFFLTASLPQQPTLFLRKRRILRIPLLEGAEQYPLSIRKGVFILITFWIIMTRYYTNATGMKTLLDNVGVDLKFKLRS